MFETLGTSTRGDHAGHVRLRDRSRDVLRLTTQRKVLALRERDDRTVLPPRAAAGAGRCPWRTRRTQGC
jgi:hypothetical protein